LLELERVVFFGEVVLVVLEVAVLEVVKFKVEKVEGWLAHLEDVRASGCAFPVVDLSWNNRSHFISLRFLLNMLALGKQIYLFFLQKLNAFLQFIIF
jgi:hypothetical protein